jgi:hypothetical protein
MRFNNLSSKEKAEEKKSAFEPLPKGVYLAEILEKEDKTFSTGTTGVSLKLSVMNNGKSCWVYDNLFNIVSMSWKTLHFCRAIGNEKLYDNFDSDLIPTGIDVLVSIDIQEANGNYPARNVISDYLEQDNSVKQSPVVGSTVIDDQDIPF